MTITCKILERAKSMDPHYAITAVHIHMQYRLTHRKRKQNCMQTKLFVTHEQGCIYGSQLVDCTCQIRYLRSLKILLSKRECIAKLKMIYMIKKTSID